MTVPPVYPRPRSFTPDEDAFLAANVRTMMARDMAAALGRTKASVDHRVQRLGLSIHQKSALEVFRTNSDRSSGACWRWTGPVTEYGYGRLMAEGQSRMAHRFSYEHFVRTLTGGEVVHHSCKNKLCVNPEHLHAMTAVEHIHLEARFMRKGDYCRNGHHMSEENTYRYMYRGHERRYCVNCRTANLEKRNAKRRAKRCAE